MTKALISIDYTVDFVADDGKLTAGAPAQAISETIAQVTQLAFAVASLFFPQPEKAAVKTKAPTSRIAVFFFMIKSLL